MKTFNIEKGMANRKSLLVQLEKTARQISRLQSKSVSLHDDDEHVEMMH